MASKSRQLVERREALVARCADQRAQVAQEVAMLSSPQTLGLIPAYAARHQKTWRASCSSIGACWLRPSAWSISN